MKFGVVVFPGTWSDVDCYEVIDQVLKYPVQYVWHNETDLSDYDCIILPGGFSYGDFLRPGAIAKFSPVMRSLQNFSEQGKTIIGICNGFQILCEAGLLPGVLLPNDHLQFRCQWVNLKIENAESIFTNEAEKGEVLNIPISHGEGNYYVDDETLKVLESENRVLFRYCDRLGDANVDSNPNGSLNNIAGIINESGNVLGMMPHPERCCDQLIGGEDGLTIFQSIISSFALKGSGG